MKIAKVTLKGISPLLMHRFPTEPIEAFDKKPIEEQAEISAYRMPNTGHLYMPDRCVHRGLVAAAAFSKGKGRATLSKTAAACFIVTPGCIPIMDGTTNAPLKTYVIDTQPVVVPATGGRVLRHRPRLDEWQITFMLHWDPELLKEEQVRRVIDDLGSRVGLLDFRPERKGSYGRSQCNEFKVQS